MHAISVRPAMFNLNNFRGLNKQSPIVGSLSQTGPCFSYRYQNDMRTLISRILLNSSCTLCHQTPSNFAEYVLK
jgi:hypothetical protein